MLAGPLLGQAAQSYQASILRIIISVTIIIVIIVIIVMVIVIMIGPGCTELPGIHTKNLNFDIV